MGKISEFGDKVLSKLKPTEKNISKGNEILSDSKGEVKEKISTLEETITNSKIEDKTEEGLETRKSENPPSFTTKSQAIDRAYEDYYTVYDSDKPEKEKKKYVYKKLVDTRLVIILIENTKSVSLVNDSIEKIIKMFTSDEDEVYLISYDDKVKVEKSKEYNINQNENSTNSLCLYDAVYEIKKLFTSKIQSIIEETSVRKKITSCLIVGIGTCQNTVVTEENNNAIFDFNELLKNKDITSKYFCLTDENVISAAIWGFHSIGSISSKY